MSAPWRRTRPTRLSRLAARFPLRFATRLTLRGGVFLVGGIGLFVNALIINSRDLLFVASLLVMAPVVALGSVLLRPVRLEVTRVFRPPIVSAGGETVVSLQLHNLSTSPLGGARWTDTPPPGIEVPQAALLPLLGRYGGDGNTAKLEYTLSPRQRGVYEIGPLRIERHDPFGLATNARRVGDPHELVVTPRVTALPGGGLALAGGDGSIRELLRQATPTSDELIAREYRPGDPLRRVNWPATARYGEIMVRQEEQRSNPEARIILDTTLNGWPQLAARSGGAHQIAAFELAIEVVASVGVHLLDAGFRVQVVETGPSQLAPGADQNLGGMQGDAPAFFRSPAGDRALLEGLANVVPVDAASTAARVRDDRSTASRTPPRGTAGALPTFAVLVALSDDDVDALVRLARHCEPAVAFIHGMVTATALDRLEGAGWTCLPIGSTRDIARAWDDVQPNRGALHD